MTSTGETLTDPVRIAMWSGPRNISTAMMRSFGARQDCAVSDEPFYGAYLKTSGIPQPMAVDVIASMDCDWSAVAADMRASAPGGKVIWYQKHMPHHMIEATSIADFPDHQHAFLIRDPASVVASYAAKRVEVTLDDLGYARQLDYAEQVSQMSGAPATILDSADILHNPEAHLKALCTALNISWDPAMLNWETGIRESDGIWASHWYGRVIETTTFAPPSTSTPKLTSAQQKVVDGCQPYYDKLSEMKLKIL